jgi:uncharacterized protein YdeI (YjbR/CyaY-like superfamily)
MATKSKRDLPVMAFASREAWDAWLSAQSVGAKGLWLKIAKKSSGVKTISRDEAVDAALCHGWIDGQLDRFDSTYWLIRFTPRTSTSVWSEKNRVRALELVEEGRMRPAGLRQIECAQKDGRWQRAYASPSKAEVPDDLAAALAKNRKARAFFETLNRQNRYAILYRIHTAKKPETRAARIEKFVAMLASGETIYPQKTTAPPKAGAKAVKAPKKQSSGHPKGVSDR